MYFSNRKPRIGALIITLLSGISIESQGNNINEYLIIADNSTRTENTQSVQQQNKIKEILAMARDSMLAKRYKNPIGYNALAQFRAVLKIDSSNKEAKQGIFEIAKHYQFLAIQAKHNENQKQEIRFRKIVKSIYRTPKALDRFKKRLENIKKSDQKLKEIRTLSLKVKRNLMAKRYILPKKDNVLYYCRQILLIDPDNKRARSAIKNLLEHFIGLTELAEKNNQIEEINKYLNILISISPDSSIVQSIRRRIATAETNRQNQEKIKDLLLKAKNNIDSENYSTPKNNNAIAQFYKVLKLDRGNLEAKSGLQTISERYVTLAQKSIKKRQVDNAKKYLKIAYSLAPNSDNVPQAQQALTNIINQIKAKKDKESNNAKNQKSDKIKALLRLADQDLKADRLTLPKSKNALYQYKKILQLDSRNKQAKKGLVNIQERYISLANQAISLQEFDKANNLIITAASILPNSPSVQNSSQKLKDAIQRQLEIEKQNAILSLKHIIGKWCNSDFSIQISQNQWIYHLQDDDIVYAISRFGFSKEQISIFWTDKKGGGMITEFNVNAKDNSSRIVQLRGKPISNDKWFNYNREFTSCQ